MEQTVLEPERKQSEQQEEHRPPRKPLRKGLGRLLLIAFLVLFVAAAVIGFIVRASEGKALAKETETLAVPSVVVIRPKIESQQQQLDLPSTLQAYTESPIYARTNGYLARWYKDIGAGSRKANFLPTSTRPKSIRN